MNDENGGLVADVTWCCRAYAAVAVGLGLLIVLAWGAVYFIHSGRLP